MPPPPLSAKKSARPAAAAAAEKEAVAAAEKEAAAAAGEEAAAAAPRLNSPAGSPSYPTVASRRALGWSREQLIEYGHKHNMDMDDANFKVGHYVTLDESDDESMGANGSSTVQ